MGSYVSTAQCRVNCNATDVILQGFEPDPDVAGIGVIFAFFSVALLALSMSAIYLILQLTKFMRFTGVNTLMGRRQEDMCAEDRSSTQTTWPDIFEAIILSCSDQQVFTSGAYALTLRYARGCKVSAYHYNIVANMMLVTCATHLMSVTVVSQYWKHKLVAVFRAILITLLYIITGVLLSNQGAGSELPWPTAVPKNNSDASLGLPAACFQSGNSTLVKTLGASFQPGQDWGFGVVRNSSSNSRIVGWNFFILMILWYGAAIIAEVFRLWYNRPSRRISNDPQSRRKTWGKWVGRVFWFYQFAGAALSMAAIVSSFNYIRGLRSWMNKSPWLKRGPGKTNSENDPTSFGQLVPLLLILLTVFTVLQLIGGKSSLIPLPGGTDCGLNPCADKFNERWKNMRRNTTLNPEVSESYSSFQKLSSQDLPKGGVRAFQLSSVPPTPPSGLDEPRYQNAPPKPPPTPPSELEGPQYQSTPPKPSSTPPPELDRPRYQSTFPKPPSTPPKAPSTPPKALPTPPKTPPTPSIAPSTPPKPPSTPPSQ
ncbi:MAG: hypothetical protein M1840_001091 [Geoglossum simile]|nr:MAG: hypothetical protein M1840_001091 [Geoglossum simile]